MMRFEYGVVGAGVVGSAIAYHLARRGHRVVLAERGLAGSLGATSYRGGIIRGFDTDLFTAQLCTEGLDHFRNWEALGYPGSRPSDHVGFLYLLDPAKQCSAQHVIENLGVTSGIRFLSKRELRRYAPFVPDAHAGLAVLDTKGGLADPTGTTQALCEGLRRFGATVLERATLSAISAAPGGGWRLGFGAGSVLVERLVLATGASTRTWLPSLPIVSRAVSLVCVESPDPIALPVYDEISGAYLRPAGPGMIYCGRAALEQEIDGTSADVPSSVYEQIHARARVTIGDGSASRIVHGMTGCDAYTPTGLPYLDFVDADRTLYVATGFSGRGFKYALWAGDAVAVDLCGERTGASGRLIDLSAYRLPDEALLDR
ncbi:FAD-binding oxidoreductase [Burkholderia sp. Bp9125]|nr:FAD-binding oxidoreductase [Burkholderia sp. Bp9125]